MCVIAVYYSSSLKQEASIISWGHLHKAGHVFWTGLILLVFLSAFIAAFVKVIIACVHTIG